MQVACKLDACARDGNSKQLTPGRARRAMDLAPFVQFPASRAAQLSAGRLKYRARRHQHHFVDRHAHQVDCQMTDFGA